jgi:hypothetical protein
MWGWQWIWTWWVICNTPYVKVSYNHVKIKLSYTCTCHEDILGSGHTDPLIHNLRTRWEWAVSFTSKPLYSRERVFGTHWIGDCVGPRPSLDVWVRDKSLAFARNWTTFLRHPIRSFVIVPNMHNPKVRQVSVDFTTV